MCSFRSKNLVYQAGLRPTGILLQPEKTVATISRYLSKRGFSTAAQTPRARASRVAERLIKTLKPEKMVEVGQNVHRLTTPLHFYHIRQDQPLLSLYTTNLKKRRERSKVSLPENRAGVFYYHQEPGLPEIAGHIRYRLCDDVSKFHEGQDFNYRPCIPWTLHISRAMAQDEAREGLGSLLLQEGLINANTINNVKSVLKGQNPERCLFRFDQPFYFDLSQQKIDCALVTNDSFHTFHLSGMRDHRLEQPFKGKSPYTGVVRARFELSDHPEHQGQGPTLVLRILETLTPVQCIVWNYDKYWAMPEANKLNSRFKFKSGEDGGGGSYEPWSYRLDSQPEGEKLKQFIRLTSPEVRI